MASSIVTHLALLLWGKPVWEALSVDMVWSEVLYRTSDNLTTLVLLAHSLLVVVKPIKKVSIEGVETHLNEWKLRDWQRIEPAKNIFDKGYSLGGIVLTLACVEIFQRVDSAILLHALLEGIPCLRELFVILSNDVNAFDRVEPGRSLSSASTVITMFKSIINKLVNS